MKRNRKFLAVLLTLSMLVTLLVPMVGPASAATTYSMTNVTKVAAGFSGSVGALLITMDGTSLMNASPGHPVFFDLPSSPANYTAFPTSATAGYYSYTPVGGSVTSSTYVPTGTAMNLDSFTVNGIGATVSNGSNIANAANLLSITKVSATEFKLDFNETAAAYNAANPGLSPLHSSDNLQVSIPLAVTVPTGVSGPVNLVATAQSSSMFSSGTIVVDNVGSGIVTLASESTPSLTSSGGTIGVIDVKEDISGALVPSASGKSLQLTLPPGITWNTAATSVVWGDATLNIGAINNNANAPSLVTSNNGRELDLLMKRTNNTSGATFLKLTGAVSIDESTAKSGDITVNVGGDSTTNTSSFSAGTYGSIGLSAKAFSSTNIIAGQAGQKIGEFEIDEATPGSLIADGTRTITLTLPSNVEWADSTPTVDQTNSQNNASLNLGSTGSNSLECEGSSANVLKMTIAGGATNTNPAKLVVKNLEVTPALDFSGDLVCTVGGSEGITGTVTLSKVAAPVTMSAASTPNLIIGQSTQNVGDLTITESGAGYISGTITTSYAPVANNAVVNLPQTAPSVSYTTVNTTTSGETMLTLEAPSGVFFASTPTVKVTSGDMQLDTVSTDTGNNNKGLMYIKIKSSSTQPSTISISGIQVNVDRTVPAGDVNFTVEGNAINQTYTVTSPNVTTDDSNSLFPGHNKSVSAKVATVTTPAPENQKQTAVFTIGSSDFTLNGTKTTMDAAPYIKNDRTYLPIRFVAQAVGVTDSNIIWNANDQSVTLIKGGTIVKLAVGDTTMTINGTPVTMDVAPEIVDPGRTMLPVRWVAQALGCTINWDAATQTVTIN